MQREEIGQVVHFYSKIGVAILRLESPLLVGDRIAIVGATTDLEQEVSSLQVEHSNIEAAQPDGLVGLKVNAKVRAGDTVFKLQ